MTLRRLALGVLTAVVGVALLVGLTLPPPRRTISAPGFSLPHGAHMVRGAYHVHTTRSDGSGSLDDVARAAAAAGLDFVIVSDHGDGMRAPEPPAYRAGVLIIDAVEISTRQGHYVALGLPAVPYPLAGEPADVVTDVARLGGFGIAAHPDSRKPGLRWSNWDLPIDGFEWVNGDSEWRDESWPALSRTLAHYFVRPVEALATLFDRPAPTMARWDAFGTHGRRLIALAGADAHARLGWRADDGDDGTVDPARVELRIPAYENVFRAFSMQVTMAQPWRAEAATDAVALMTAIRAGRVATVVDGLVQGGRVSFTAGRGTTFWPGDVVPDDGPLTFRVVAAAPEGARILLLRNGTAVAESTGLTLTHEASASPRGGEVAVAWRVEVLIGGEEHGAAVPWMSTNAIYSGRVQRPVESGADVQGRPVPVDLANGWTIEKDGEADGALDATATEVSLTYRLASRHDGTWVAAVRPIERLGDARAIEVDARSDRPMRLRVQLRAPAPGGQDVRWSRSIPLGLAPTTVRLPTATFQPIDRALGPQPTRAVSDLLLVVDRVNSEPGAQGTVWIRAIRVIR